MSIMDFMVGTCCVVGAICIGIAALHIFVDTWQSIRDRLRIRRFVWMTKGNACITEQELEDMAFAEAGDWWKGHRRESIWNRHDDFRAGMLAASRAILRQRGIHVVKNNPKRRPAPPDAKEKGRP